MEALGGGLLLQTLATWGAAGAAGIGTAAVLLRRLSRDRTAIVKDRAESTLVELLLKERDQAIREWHKATFARQADSEVIARLSAQNEHLARESVRVAAELASIKRKVVRMYPESGRFFTTDPGGLQ